MRIGSVLRNVPPTKLWQPLVNSKSWAVELPLQPPKDLVVVLDGKPLVTQFRETPPEEKKLDWATYRSADRTLIVNVGVQVPLHATRFNWPVPPRQLLSGSSSASGGSGNWRLPGSMRNSILCGHGNLVEDCDFHNTFREGIFLHGRLSTVRRCSFHQCGYGIGASGSGPGNIIEDCLFVESGQDWEEDISHRAMNLEESLGPTTWKGDAYGQIFRYNVVADCKGELWYDGGETGCRVIGNAFWDNRYGNGIYNEYCANDTLLLGNYFLHTNIVSSWCTRFNVIDNFVDGGLWFGTTTMSGRCARATC